MNWTIYGMECVGALILFTCLIMIPLCKNPVWWIHDYPKNIQEKYFETHEHMDKAYHQKKYHVVRSVIGMALGLVPCLLCALIVAALG